MADYEIHPLCSIFPQMGTAELEELAADIRTNGQLEPIVLHKGKILDGRNRYFACQLEGIQPWCEEFESGDDGLLSFVVSRNLHRRHLTESQRAMVAARLANMQQGRQPEKAQICAFESPEVSQREAAEQLNVSRRSVQQARKVQEHGAPELVSAVDAGAVTVSDAAKIAEQPAETQRAAVAAVRGGGARTVASAVVQDEENAISEAFRTLERAIGAAARANDDLARLLGDNSRSRILNLLGSARSAVDDWRKAAADKAASKLAATDRLNRAVPERFAALFARGDVFESLRMRLNGIKGEVDSLCQEPLGIFLHRQSVLADLENVKQALKFARPHTVCPYCKGSGCKGCRQQGWVPQDVYRAAPREMKAETNQEAA